MGTDIWQLSQCGVMDLPVLERIIPTVFFLHLRSAGESIMKTFSKTSHAVSNLKLRAGVGTVGNQQIGNLAAYTLYYSNYGTSNPAYPLWLNTGTAYDLQGVNTGTLPSGFVQTQLGNPNLKWESTNRNQYRPGLWFPERKNIWII